MAKSGATDSARRGIPWRLVGWGAAGSLLLLPLVAMRFTGEVNWTLSDFVFMGVMLGSVGLGLELAARKGNAAYMMASGVALVAAFLLVCVNGAVGIIGSEEEDANLLFLGVVLLALLGAIAARFRPVGMARAMAMAAAADAAVPLVALGFGPEARASVWSPEVPVLTAFFVAMWLLSAWLFRRAARGL